MGITIHYRGRAINYDAVQKIMTTAQLFAAQRDWMFAIFEDPMGVMDDLDKDDPGYLEHEGPIRGIILRPHPGCDSVRLTFGIHHDFEGFTKTQYAPFEIHADIVKLLRAIAPYMGEFEVVDEAGLWETGDADAAMSKFQFLHDAIDSIKGELSSPTPANPEENEDEGWQSPP